MVHHHLGLALAILQAVLTADAYSIGDVDPRALRGVWRLTSLDDEGLPFERRNRPAFLPPQSKSPDPKNNSWKEFTTYPKKENTDMNDNNNNNMDHLLAATMPKKQTEIFIKLKDDHTFQQCASLQFSDGVDEDNSLEEELQMEVSKREKESFVWKGTWDFVDGKLILAADRPEKKPLSFDGDKDTDNGESGDNVDVEADTILVGKVAVQSEESLTDNPALEQRQMMMDDPSAKENESASPRLSKATDKNGSPSSQPKKGTIDVHLSVPKGKIKTGKFMYPKTHPSFFEQPIIRPQSRGRFELKQVLGEYNAKLADDEGDLTELFRKKDLVGKKFYLSAFPIPKRRKKFEKWDVVKSKYVQMEYEPTAEEKKDEALQPGKNMQVMSVELHANNTFSTLGGLGDSTIFRGKWSIIGEKRDQLWMMVYRFGFGRSVSGSTFSEGTSLTQNDEKGYWGEITELEYGGKDNIEGDPAECSSKKLEIKGTVLVGWGLEPTTVGRFKMIELEDVLEEEDTEEEDDEDDDEYEEMSADDVIENANKLDSILGTGDLDFDDSSDSIGGGFE